ncbi:DUF1801 domain-containing protein [Daejeonella sp.]|uniref:iron chaperone n=1 Tax=Daejeonella sp. TaxID=2805397 RepID=UPI0025C4C87A|nr:DUF1801 domain-containing protein [Daejeonella sp.]
MKNTVKYQNIDEYLDSIPQDLKNKLQILRSTIQEAAPDSTEAICYQMPTFKLNGNLLHFAAYKTHIGFYPGPSAIKAFVDELAPYNLSKGTIRFTLEDEIPLNLIFRIVKFRVEQNKSKLKAK